jgi:hypothetical protein
MGDECSVQEEEARRRVGVTNNHEKVSLQQFTASLGTTDIFHQSMGRVCSRLIWSTWKISVSRFD